jgi:hypothetical protein
MPRIVGLILALALTIGGTVWLVFQIFVAEDFSRNLVVAAFIVFAVETPGLGKAPGVLLFGEEPFAQARLVRLKGSGDATVRRGPAASSLWSTGKDYLH